MAARKSAFRRVLWIGLCGLVAAGVAWYYWPAGRDTDQAGLDQAEKSSAAKEQPASIAAGKTQDPQNAPQSQNAAADQPGQGQAATGRQRKKKAGAGAGASDAVPVIVTTVRTGDISVSLNGLGTVTPLATVVVKPQLSGYLTEIGFTEGQLVKRGDFLAQIDPRPYQIALEQAQGQLARDQALLRNANIDLARYQKLSAQDSIAHQQLDTQLSLVQQLQGTIISDQAQIDTARLDLDYCHITAPVTGRVGLRQVDQGNYVQAGDATGLVVITQIQPISVIFTIPEDNIPMVQRRMLAGATLAATAYDRSQSTKLATGTLATLNNQIDIGTGTVKLRAQFDNTDSNLFPNQFVNVTLLVDTEHAAAIVPVAAIQHGSTGTFVYLVTAKNTVAVQPVTIGTSSSQDVAVLSGLKAGDQVVVDGVDMLRDGSKVTVSELGAAKSSSANAVPTNVIPGSKAAQRAPGGAAN
ncbi:MAG TPA: MdtA/MuxA family multidrug efflux RND transporter periplasmic adaptor subunit [Dongiaceae bacterium]